VMNDPLTRNARPVIVGALLHTRFAGYLEARPAGFEPATGGLEVRCSVP
jgi:hypothetical protein